MLRPFRAFNPAEVRACLDAAGGADSLRLTFFKEGDIGNDGVWDICTLEGPRLLLVLPWLTAHSSWLNVDRQGLEKAVRKSGDGSGELEVARVGSGEVGKSRAEWSGEWRMRRGR